MDELSPPWAQQPDEPALWYALFETYRQAGPGRSLLAIYNAGREKARKRPARSVPGAWQRAANEWRWTERAAAWDLAQLAEARAAWERDYQSKVEHHQQNALRVTAATFETAYTLLCRLADRLDSMQDENIPLAQIPAWLRASSAIAEAALNAEAQALAVGDLLRALDAGRLAKI